MSRLHIPRYKTLISILLILLMLLTVAYLLLSYKRPLPKSIRQQVNFLVLYPGRNSGVSVDTSTFKYEPTNKVLSYTVKSNQHLVIMSEQPTPDSFTDVPQAYDKLIQSLGEYSSFDSLLGKVHLTRPKDLNNQQSAIMNAKGTLLFAHPIQEDLSDDEWRVFFNGLRVIQ